MEMSFHFLGPFNCLRKDFVKSYLLFSVTPRLCSLKAFLGLSDVVVPSHTSSEPTPAREQLWIRQCTSALHQAGRLRITR